MIGCAIAVVLALVIAIPIAVTNNKNGSSSDSADSQSKNDISATDDLPPPDLSAEEMADLQTLLENASSDFTSALTENDPSTAQHRAFLWLASNPLFSTYSDRKKIQRYALATLYHSTNNVPHPRDQGIVEWTDEKKEGWLTVQDECHGWAGVSCTDDGWVNGIELNDNNMAGVVPEDLLVLKDSLEVLNLHDNLFNMDGEDFAFIGEFTNLRQLYMSENYFETENGLPSSFGQLVKLEELGLNRNLLSGQLPDFWGGMSELYYLDMEANYLTGSIPQSIGQITSLEQFYVRVNLLEGDLSFMESGKLTNLHTFWMDDNKVGKSIPTEIGLMTALDGLSLVENSLTGSIPTEVGKLINLSKLWLYDNLLDGEVPTEIGSLPKLEKFEIQENDFVGVMPSQICDLTKNDGLLKDVTSDCNNEIVCGCCVDCV